MRDYERGALRWDIGRPVDNVQWGGCGDAYVLVQMQSVDSPKFNEPRVQTAPELCRERRATETRHRLIEDGRRTRLPFPVWATSAILMSPSHLPNVHQVLQIWLCEHLHASTQRFV